MREGRKEGEQRKLYNITKTIKKRKEKIGTWTNELTFNKAIKNPH